MINLIKKHKALSFGVFTVIILCMIIFLRNPHQESKSHFDKLETSTPSELETSTPSELETSTPSELETSTIVETNQDITQSNNKNINTENEEFSNTIENPFIKNLKDTAINQKLKDFENSLTDNTITADNQIHQENLDNTKKEVSDEEIVLPQPQNENIQEPINELEPSQDYTKNSNENSLQEELHLKQQELVLQQDKEQKCQVAECKNIKYETGEERAKNIKESEAMLFDYNGLIINSYKQLEYLNLQKVFSFSEKDDCINIVNEKEWCLGETRYGTNLIKINKNKKIIRIKILKDSVYVNLTIKDKEIK